MGHVSRYSLNALDSVDILIFVGFACIVAGVAWRYDYALALIVLGIGLLFIGAVALWRNT
jgi:hypothetical protein